MLARRAVVLFGGKNKYLMWDRYDVSKAAGSVNGTLAEPGGAKGTLAQNTRVVTDTGNLLSISGGEILATSAAAANDPRLSYGPFTRTAGLTWTAWLYWTSQRGGFGWGASVNPSGGQPFLGIYGPAQLTVVPPAAVGFIQLAVSNYYRIQATLFATGGAVWAQDGGGSYSYTSPTLLWVDEFTTTTPAYVIINASSVAHNFKCDWQKVYQNNIYTTAASIASVYIANPVNGTNYTTVADALHYLTFALPGVPVGGDKIELRYRYQDATNYWTAYVIYNGGTAQWDFYLDEVLTSGTITKTTVANVGAVTGLCVASYGNSHTPFTRTGAGATWTIRGATITDADLNTATEVGAWYGAGTVSQLEFLSAHIRRGHYVISFPSGVAQATTTAQGIYRPEAYGGVGDGVADDKAAVQAALDAAGGAGGGTVRLDQTYAYTDGVVHGEGEAEGKIGPYTSTVGIWIDASNIILDGNGTGVLRLSALPTFTASYIALLVGNGGFSGGVLPGDGTYAWLEANGTWTENVTVRNLTFDNSILTDANLATLTVSTIGAVMELAFCRNCTVEGITVDRGYGSTGVIGSHSSSQSCTFRDCTVTLTYSLGYWFDGAKDHTIDNCDVGGYVGTGYNQGLICATNVDYLNGSSYNAISNCTIAGATVGIGGSGPYSTISDCVITIGSGGPGGKEGISLSTRDAAAGAWWHHHVTVTGNTIARGAGVEGTIFGIQLSGDNATLIDGLPRECSENTITGNTFSAAATAYALVLNVQASRNIFTGNTITASISADVSGGTAVDNTIQTEKTP